MERLKGRSAIITGAGGNIGRALTLGYAAEGARVTCADLRLPAAQATAEAVRAAGGEALAVEVDVSRRDQVLAMVQAALTAYGRLDILLAVAGIGPSSPFLELAEEEWDRVLAVNLKGQFLCGQAAARHMAAHGGGVIINVTSQLSEVAQTQATHYLASKGGGKMLTKGMAVELAPYGIRVNALAPGLTGVLGMSRIDTEAARAARSKIVEHIPMGRPARPDELVGAAVFLASDESAYMTGASLFIDGGYLAI